MKNKELILLIIILIVLAELVIFKPIFTIKEGNC